VTTFHSDIHFKTNLQSHFYFPLIRFSNFVLLNQPQEDGKEKEVQEKENRAGYNEVAGAC
jgi:hypothetical protein